MKERDALLRESMVEEQLIPRGINDRRVLDAMRKVPRHLFVPDSGLENAYGDHPMPIGEGQTISQPYIVALMTQSLGLKGTEKVLEIGTGSGYQAAILSLLSKEVYSIDRYGDLSQKAGETLGKLAFTNIKLMTGDGTEGWKEFAPYDAIIVTAATPSIPQPLLDQLTEHGRIVVPVGGSFSQTLMLARKEAGGIIREEICGCVFVPLVGKYGWKQG
ncbi:MAG TPA: protein-L-isoaspartate(D-aspartate) O-methyltransferase [Candidatus Omnitrophota bacterium]|nr:protein-L-isoaspartate(D-aspartate) O-methyltransferase [Candidatus Omnitrophota bacterium]HPN66789.1 protein-L-isoaspartate(D-aspartate) O-methyltransferase [Candidatus Omnitrophota bacterium]HRZ67095.1 protein-L-isoaspartate(D-aspartate) O-methyltransferase [Candidatus Omnitrophota bacterium]